MTVLRKIWPKFSNFVNCNPSQCFTFEGILLFFFLSVLSLFGPLSTLVDYYFVLFLPEDNFVHYHGDWAPLTWQHKGSFGPVPELSLFCVRYVGVEPKRGKRESKITCMCMLRNSTPPPPPSKLGENHIWQRFWKRAHSWRILWRGYLLK